MNPADEQFDFNERKIHLFHAMRTLRGPNYLAVLKWIHEALAPANYVEIGVNEGDSLQAAALPTRCVAIDPCPAASFAAPPGTRLFTMTSNEFFLRHDLRGLLDDQPFSLAFIDGLHLFEQALLDFVNLERYAGPGSVILLHDCVPLNADTSSRTRTTHFYSGDVWKTTLCIRELRPDLQMAIVPTSPTGLCIVSGLDPRSTLLAESYDACTAAFRDLTFDDYRMRMRQMPPAIGNNQPAITAHLRTRRMGGRAVEHAEPDGGAT
ncbi:MAG TPA: class I SAM-dependent methyltransferase [Vicinamibacterales bacterium]|nr:class I SAM-dependent methyltransferase [Vicinamibacterales bacterium]